MAQPSESPYLIYGLILVTAIAGALGDIFIYNWAKTNVMAWMVAACLVFLVSIIAFGFLIKLDTRSLSAAFLIVSMVHAAAVLGCDWLYYGERLNRVECIGMAMAVATIVVLEIGHSMRPEAPVAEVATPHVEENS